MHKYVKLAAGLALAGVGGYVLLSEGVAVVSASAVVNTRVAVVRAPIDGLLSLEPRTVGERVRSGQPLGTLNDVRADDSRLLDLERSANALDADLTRLHAQIAANADTRDTLHARTEAYRQGRISQLRARIDEQQALLAASKAQSVESSAALERAEELRDRGVQSVAVLDRAQTVHEVNTRNIRAAAARLDSLRTELDAAEMGMFLGDSYNDTPYSSQRSQELDLRLAELKADLQERTQRLAKTRDQIAVERQRVARMRDAFLASPVDGQVWESILGNGEYARKGQDLLRLLDCGSVMVTASVSESDYNRLAVGDPAQFRLSGTDRVYDGRVLRLAGSGAATVYNNLAIAPGAEHLKRFDVAIAVPGLLEDPDAGCAVGRTGKVVFSGTPTQILRTLASWFGLA